MATVAEIAEELWGRPDGLSHQMAELKPRVTALEKIAIQNDRFFFWLKTFIVGAIVSFILSLLGLAVTVYLALYSPSAQWAQMQIDSMERTERVSHE